MTGPIRHTRRIALLAILLGLGFRPAGAQVLFWLDTNYGAPTLSRSDPNAFVVTSVPLTAGTLAEGLALEAGGKLFWTESAWTGARIERAAPTLAGITPVVTGGSTLRGIAVDNVAHQLYWTSSNLATGAAIYRSALDGSGATLILSLGPLANPRGIAVDPVGGWMYWTDFDQNAIYRAHLDGTLSMIWFGLAPTAEPYGILFDPAAQMLYWSEYGSGQIRRSPIFGPSPIIVASGLVNPTYLALDPVNMNVYWIDGSGGTQHLRRVPEFGGAPLTLPPVVATYGGLAFQPNASVATPRIALPTEFSLERPWPLPSHDAVHLAFALPRDAEARLTVLDLQGRVVAVLADERLPAGRYERVWNARVSGAAAPAGIYFARLAAGGRTWSQRVALIP